ncbi:malonyl-CoA decarboxylase domain-containing protein [Aliiruegeria lutimaris]|uniref:Malonyl-CoA decarboxylase n=1 Tax=Aliiruegeria lutimaris TaxID=571298 RepID=A0A1G9GNN3_9RHOB|nr:malonyl-CoA decarboxylase [Aliiruegeria lutimaris]SDL02258.1 malonyl-CoA decarboxylase [Aliiruegeria lutimaris]
MRAPAPLASLLSGIFQASPAVRPADDDRSLVELCRELISARGESSTLRLAVSALAAYADRPEAGKLAFFRYLLDELDVAPAEIMAAASAYADAPSPGTLEQLLIVSEPKRQELFRKLNQADGATTHLVNMRKDLLCMMTEHPDLGRIDLDFMHLFTSWFNRGFLMLDRVNWSTPATILEKIIAYEAVHEIDDWEDLRRRTQPNDRRCYAYFHPRMPEEPLIFVEVALTKGVPVSVQDVLAVDRSPIPATQADTAVFYSISNCQVGLKGISFGNSLIKHVVSDISLELPNLKTFVTLSPIPGLRRWFEEQAGETAAPPEGEALRQLAATYLAAAKRHENLPRDPVARFHLSNGASIENVLADADLSANGIRQSFGAMANYRYDAPHVEAHSERFATDHTVSLSRNVHSLVRAGQAHIASEKWNENAQSPV